MKSPRAKLVSWSFLNLGSNCEKATRVSMTVLIVPVCRHVDDQLYRCAEAIRRTASAMRKERLARAKRVAKAKAGSAA